MHVAHIQTYLGHHCGWKISTVIVVFTWTDIFHQRTQEFVDRILRGGDDRVIQVTVWSTGHKTNACSVSHGCKSLR